MRIGLVSCAKQKRIGAHQAKDLYVSTLFAFALRCATDRCEKVFILSPKHGLLEPMERLWHYDITLNKMASFERRAWAHGVYYDLRRYLREGDEVEFFCGKKYREFLLPLLSKKVHCVVPLEGLPIGRQLQWYKQNAPE